MIDFTQTAPELARSLIGCGLFMTDERGKRGGIIIETEAYTANDEASHSFRGQTKRNAPMFMAPGTIYIYLIYGMHRCINVVCGNHDGQAVLIRAIKPTTGVGFMQKRRPISMQENLANGPAKLYQALDIPAELNGVSLSKSPIAITEPAIKPTVKATKRIGITKSTGTLWRFLLEETNSVKSM